MADGSFEYDDEWDEDVFYAEPSQQLAAGLIGFEVTSNIVTATIADPSVHVI
jgi:hypothetical protein